MNSLYLVMVAIAIVTYYFTGIENIQSQRGNSSISVSHKRPKLFYDTVNLEQYFDTIALNYRDKIPLIFGKWTLLKSQLGAMLYDSFDFLIYKANRFHTFDETIWSIGTKEYYDEIQALAYNSTKKLLIIFLSGKAIVKEFENHQSWIVNNSRMIPVYGKLNKVEVMVKYADIVFTRNYKPFREVQNIIPQFIKSGDIKIIGNMFMEEISFLFYLSLNTIFSPRSYKYPSRLSRIENNELIVPHKALEEDRNILRLGGPRERLMAILSKDKTIKQWFSTWIASIIEYRQQTSNKMSEFYGQIIDSNGYSIETKPKSDNHKKAT